MRSDFYGLPWAAQQAIRRGEHDASVARRRAWTIRELNDHIEKLEAELLKATEALEETQKLIASSAAIQREGGVNYWLVPDETMLKIGAVLKHRPHFRVGEKE